MCDFTCYEATEKSFSFVVNTHLISLCDDITEKLILHEFNSIIAAREMAILFARFACKRFCSLFKCLFCLRIQRNLQPQFTTTLQKDDLLRIRKHIFFAHLQPDFSASEDSLSILNDTCLKRNDTKWQVMGNMSETHPIFPFPSLFDSRVTDKNQLQIRLHCACRDQCAGLKSYLVCRRKG